jgi:hypothetical protein
MRVGSSGGRRALVKTISSGGGNVSLMYYTERWLKFEAEGASSVETHVRGVRVSIGLAAVGRGIVYLLQTAAVGCGRLAVAACIRALQLLL